MDQMGLTKVGNLWNPLTLDFKVERKPKLVTNLQRKNVVVGLS
jgi:hypothetical protein